MRRSRRRRRRGDRSPWKRRAGLPGVDVERFSVTLAATPLPAAPALDRIERRRLDGPIAGAGPRVDDPERAADDARASPLASRTKCAWSRPPRSTCKASRVAAAASARARRPRRGANAQGEWRRRGLAERRRQVDGHADEVAGDSDLRMAAGEGEADAIRGLPGREGREAGQRSELGGLAQGLGGGDAAAAEALRVAAVQAGARAAVASRRRARGRCRALTVKPLCEKSTRALAAASSGVSAVMRTSLPASASVPLTVVSLGRAERHAERELELGRAGRRRGGERLAGPAPDRRRVDEAQHVGERAARGAVDVEPGLAAELGDAALDRAPLDAAELPLGGADLERRAVDDQLARGRGERRPGLARGRRRRSRPRVAGHVGEGHAVDLGGDVELAVARDLGVVERKVPEVAADAEGRARDRSFAHRSGDVAAHAVGQAERQVARGARGDAVDELAVELELARIAAAARDAGAGAGAPGRGQLALGVGVGEACRRHLDAHLRRRAFRRRPRSSRRAWRRGGRAAARAPRTRRAGRARRSACRSAPGRRSRSPRAAGRRCAGRAGRSRRPAAPGRAVSERPLSRPLTR